MVLGESSGGIQRGERARKRGGRGECVREEDAPSVVPAVCLELLLVSLRPEERRFPLVLIRIRPDKPLICLVLDRRAVRSSFIAVGVLPAVVLFIGPAVFGVEAHRSEMFRCVRSGVFF